MGTMGAFTCLELARQGLSIVGIDRLRPPHDRGSHAGETRVYREAYAEHPDYVPLALLAGKLWDAYGREAGSPLLHRCGQLSIGPESSPLISGVRLSAEAHGIPIHALTTAQLQQRYPMLHIHPDEVGTLEPGAGWIDVDRALHFAIDSVERSGGHLRLDTAVDRWTVDSDSVTLHLAGGKTLRAKRLVICAGAWSKDLLSTLDLPLRVVRKLLVWAHPQLTFATAAAELPVLIFAGPTLYTFPLKNNLFKMAIHWTAPDLTSDPDHAAILEPSHLDNVIDQATRHLQPLLGTAAELRDRIAATKTCLYTMTPDEHFILDQVPGCPVWYAAGFSGHGFKFAPAIGRVMAEMCLGQPKAVPVDFLSRQRFAPQRTPAS